MTLGHDEALRSHIVALTAELDRLAERLGKRARPQEERRAGRSLEACKSLLEWSPRAAATRSRLEALHRLAMVAEDEGWLEAGEAIVLRKLAFRVAFYLRRESGHR